MKLPFGIEIKRTTTQSKKPKTNPLLSRLFSSFQYGRELSYDTDIERQLKAFRSWVYCAASLNAQSVAQTPLRLYYAKQAKNSKTLFPTKPISSKQKEYIYKNHHVVKNPAFRKAVEIEEVVEHPVLDLFKNVNNFHNAFDLWEMTDLHQELAGNAYWLIVEQRRLKIPQEIWMIPPDRITPIPDPNKFISGYLYKYGSTEYKFPEDQIIHFKFPNPANMYLGLAPLFAGIGAYNTNENMQVYNNSMFKNMGRPSGFFETDDVLDEEDFNRLKQELRDVYAGVQNVGQMGLLDHGLTFQQLGLKPEEMAFIEGRKAIREEIFNVYGQSVALWSDTSNRANADAAERMHARRTIRPRCIRMAEKLNEKLLPRYDSGLMLIYDDPSPDDKMIDAQVRKTNISTGVSTINEEREKMHLPPLDGGGDPLIQSQYLPLSAIIEGANMGGKPPVSVVAPASDKPKPPKEETPKPDKEYVSNILTSILTEKLISKTS